MDTITKNIIQTNQQTGAQAIISTLINNGIDTVFGYPGYPLLSLYEALASSDKVKHILTRHEQGAVHAAEGWSKINGKCGVVFATSGPGFTNTITGIFNAYSDNTPLLVITATTENLGNNEFQEVDVLNLTKTFTKKSFVITKPEHTVKIIEQALAAACEIPYGPVVVGVTKNVLETESVQKQYKKPHKIKVEAPHSCVLRTIDTLKNAKRPLIIAGGGCYGSESEVKELRHITHIPVVHTLMANGVADDVSVGMLGFNGREEINNCIQDADVVLVLGSKLSDRTTNYAERFLPKSKIISINVEQNNSKNVRIDKEIIGELKVVLQQMIGVIKAKNILFDIKYDWVERISNEEVFETNENCALTEASAIRTIYSYTKKYNPIVTTDVGEHQILASKIFKTVSSKNFLTSGGFGTMGYGLPAAIGAYMASPNSLVMNITGDGSFQMNIQELGTCMEYNIPLKIFIINNSALGMIKSQQKTKNYSEYQSALINPDFVKLANSYGIQGYEITDLNGLKQALSEIFVCKKPIVVDIKVEG